MLTFTRALGSLGASAAAGMTVPTGQTPPPPPPPPPTPTSPTFVMPMFQVYKPPPTPTLAYTCTADACTGIGAADFVFRLLQNLINTANVQVNKLTMYSTPAIPIDGRITAATLSAYVQAANGIGGALAIIDYTPDINYLATNALKLSQVIAQWLSLTWVEATTMMPGHWERLRAGQASVLPQPPTPVPSSVCPPGTVPTSRGCIATAPPPPPPPPPPPTPMPPMVMYVCPDGTRTSDPGTCPKPLVTPQRPYCEACPPGTMPNSDAAYQAGGPCCIPQPGTLPPPPVRVDIGPTAQLPAQPPAPPTPIQPVQPAKPQYTGCIARYNKTRKVFSIYCPIGAAPGLGLANEGLRCLYGDCGTLGADTVTPPVPAGLVKAGETAALPAGVPQAGEESDKFFRVNNPMMWLAFAGAAAVVGGGSYWVVRRRRRAA